MKVDVYAATLSATPSPGVAGAVLTLSGSGWPLNDSMEVLLEEGTSSELRLRRQHRRQRRVDQDCTVPTDLVHGAYTLAVEDGSLVVTTPFTLDPGVRVLGFNGNAAAVRVAAGQTLGLTGAGFASSSTLKATFNGTAVALSPAATTGATGAFSGSSFVVPKTTAQGRYSLVVKDSSGDSSTVKVDVYTATLSATPSPGVAGAVLTLSGSGWPLNDSMEVLLEEGSAQSFVCDASTDGSGVLDQDCTVPTDLVHGAYTLAVEDGSLVVTTPFTLDPGVRVLGFNGNAAAVRVAAGQTLGLTGAGFASSSTLKATFNGTAVALSPAATTGATGAFSGSSFVVPKTTAQGRYSLVVKDSSGDSSTVKVDVYAATLSATPSPGVAGAVLTLSGSGWPLNDSMEVLLEEGSAQSFVCDASTDGSGVLDQDCTVPTDLVHGAYTLAVEDGSLVVTTPFTLDPGVAVDNTSGQPIASAAPGSAAELSGAGFDADSLVSVKFGTHAVSFGTAPETGANGSLAGAAFTIPSVAPGVYSVSAKDASGTTASINFTVS